MKRYLLLLITAVSQWVSLGQGLVNVDIRGLGLVKDPAGMPLTGTNYVVEIVYGPDTGSMTNQLGARMPFRAYTTPNPGTWNPGTENIRSLDGFTEGQKVWMSVHVWDSEVFSDWMAASAALAAGQYHTEGYAGMSAPFEYTVGSPDNPSSLLLRNFQGFYLTPTAFPYPIYPLPCYAEVAPLRIDVPWNGGATDVNFLPLLLPYFPADRHPFATRWTNDTPVERLFPAFEETVAITNYLEISGTLGAARFVSRANITGEFTAWLSPEIGYRSYVNGRDLRVCGIRAGSVRVRIYRPPQFILLPPSGNLIPVRIQGMPDTSYQILRSDRLGNFANWTFVTTDGSGMNQELLIDRNGQPDAVFFKAEEMPP